MDEQITERLQQWSEGDVGALDDMVPWIYGELHRLAESALRIEKPGHTLQPTALVNEVYLRLAGKGIPSLASRRNFYALAARTMRQILVDHARRELAGKRGERAPHVPLDEAFSYSGARAAEFTALDQALERLARFDERKARVIELRYFTGLTVEETADLLGMSMVTVNRDLNFATAFLADQLQTQ